PEVIQFLGFDINKSRLELPDDAKKDTASSGSDEPPIRRRRRCRRRHWIRRQRGGGARSGRQGEPQPSASLAAQDILVKLLQKNKQLRLGSISDFQEVRKQNRRIEPPFKPKVMSPLSTEYIDSEFTQGARASTARHASQPDGQPVKDAPKSAQQRALLRAVRSSNLPKNEDGSLKMKAFYSYLPSGKYRDEMLKYSDLSVLFYNAFFNRFAEDRLLRGAHDGDSRLRFSQARLKIVWGPDTKEDELNAYRIMVLLMLVRYSLMRHDSCEDLPAPAYVITDIHGGSATCWQWLYRIGGPDTATLTWSA
uniref:ULP_PROTEASE domain-containing protein n=1 Tax=Macrostomum lignano TaxID=282301 RepID=A0A1I8FFP7_9PLAT